MALSYAFVLLLFFNVKKQRHLPEMSCENSAAAAMLHAMIKKALQQGLQQ